MILVFSKIPLKTLQDTIKDDAKNDDDDDDNEEKKLVKNVTLLCQKMMYISLKNKEQNWDPKLRLALLNSMHFYIKRDILHADFIHKHHNCQNCCKSS